MTDEPKRKRGRPRKTLDEARAKLLRGKTKPTRAEQKLLSKVGERIGMRAESGIAYATCVAAEWEAQLRLAGYSEHDARREAARLASDDLTLQQIREAAADHSTVKLDGDRSLIPVQTIWETDLATGRMRPVSLAENARDCGHEAPEPLSDRTKDGGYQRGRSRMEKIARKLAGDNSAKAREAAARTASMGNLGAALEAAGQQRKVTLARVRPGRKPKSEI
jgi:hypothetical protein